MKLLQRAAILTFLLFLIFQVDTYAKELDTSWANQCTVEFGAVPKDKNPSFQHVNCLLTIAATESNIPPEVVKAVAYIETGWKQFNNDGSPLISSDKGIGMMQITNKPDYDQEKLKTDLVYNIQAGVEVLSEMYKRSDLPKIKGAGKLDIENWYFAVMAYNGTVHANSPLYRATGEKNKNAYQEKVFKSIYNSSFLTNKYIDSIPIHINDLNYGENALLTFKKKEYELTDRLNGSRYFFEKGNRVLVLSEVNLRSAPGTSSKVIQLLPKYTELTVTGDIRYSFDSNSNQFVWYPVKTENGKEGFISSAYITNHKPINGLKISSSTSNTVTLTWTKQSDVTGYEIYNENTGKTIKVKGADTKSYTITGLSPATSYKFKVGSYKTYGSTSYLNGYSSTLTVVTPPAQVTKVKKSNSTANSLKLNWSKQAGVTGYEIYNVTSGKTTKIAGASATSYTMTGLKPGTSYQFKIRSYKTIKSKNYNGAYSSTFTAVTPTAQVTNVKVSSRATNSLKLTWTKQSGVTGYQIYRYDTKSKSYKLLKTIASNTNYYTISKLSAGTTYSYKVRSYKKIGKTNYYGSFSKTFKTRTTPAKVTLSSVKKASSTSMKVSWKKVTATTGYQIQYSTSSKFTSGTTKIMTVKSKNTVTSTIKSLKKGKKYYVRVRSYVTLSKTNYYSSWSTVKNVTVK